MKTLEQAAQLEQRHAATMLHTQGVVDENTRLRAALDVAEGALKILEKEKTEWNVIYKRDYGHDWSTRGNYKGF